MTGESANSLFQFTGDTYGGSFKADLLGAIQAIRAVGGECECPSACVDSFLLTLNAALVALYGFQSVGFGQSYWALVVPIIGIPVSLLWYMIISRTRTLTG